MKIWSRGLAIVDGEKIDIMGWQDRAHVIQQHTFENIILDDPSNQGILTLYKEKQGNDDKYKNTEVRMKQEVI